MLPFQDATPTPASDWRHIIRFGRNVASYKFALGRVLLELGRRQQTFVPLDDRHDAGPARPSDPFAAIAAVDDEPPY